MFTYWDHSLCANTVHKKYVLSCQICGFDRYNNQKLFENTFKLALCIKERLTG